MNWSRKKCQYTMWELPRPLLWNANGGQERLQIDGKWKWFPGSRCRLKPGKPLLLPVLSSGIKSLSPSGATGRQWLCRQTAISSGLALSQPHTEAFTLENGGLLLKGNASQTKKRNRASAHKLEEQPRSNICRPSRLCGLGNFTPH